MTSNHSNHPPARLWAPDGRPICGHCDYVGHGNRDWPTRRRPAVNVIQTAKVPKSSGANNDRLDLNDIVCAMSCLTTPNTDYLRPAVPVALEKVEANALIDTGASINAISSEVFSQLAANTRQTLQRSKSVTFAGANGSKIASIGSISLAVQLLGCCTTMTFHVVDHLVKLIIIGYP
jgi:hypothetical protein